MKPTLNEISWCKVINMFRLDRGVETCKWATSFCRATCYKWKMMVVFDRSIIAKDQRLQGQWPLLNAETWAEWASMRRKPVERFRFCTRGETFSCAADVDKIADVVSGNPGTLFWMPTRAWRNPHLRSKLDKLVRPLPNARLQASVDPTTKPIQLASLDRDGWSTMFYGNDGNVGRQGRTLCRKTWFHDDGVACDTCGICFSAQQTHVHLKWHSRFKMTETLRAKRQKYLDAAKAA